MTDLFTLADCDAFEAREHAGMPSSVTCATIRALVAALAEQVQGCPACAGIGYSSKGILCTRCILERDLLEKMGVKLCQRTFDKIKLAIQIADRIAERYMASSSDMVSIAECCDEMIDRSGNLLGWIRDYVDIARRKKAKP